MKQNLNLTSNVLFFAHSEHAIDLDWSVPLMLEFAKTSKVKVLLPSIYSFDTTIASKFPMIVGNKNISFVYLDEFYSLNTARRFLLSNKLMYKILIKVIAKFSRSKKIKEFCENSSLIFAANYLPTSRGSIADEFYRYASGSSATFVGIPLLPWVSWYQYYLYEFDYFLSSSEAEFEDLLNLDSSTEILFLGCPSFEHEEKPSVEIKIEKKIALVIMINTSNPINSSYLGFYTDIGLLIKMLETSGYDCKVKLHPASAKMDKMKFQEVGIKDDYFVYESIEMLASEISLAITYLSTSILKCVARNVKSVVYLPKAFLEVFPNDVGAVDTANMYFNSRELDTCRLEDFCYRVSSLEEITAVLRSDHRLKLDNLESQFHSKNASRNIKTYFDRLLASKP